MDKSSLFFSLRWKLAILFGSVFLILQSIFAYMSYLNARNNFEGDLKNIQTNHVNIADTLTKDSFLVLEQFAELVSVVNVPDSETKTKAEPAITSLDQNWSRWQLIWDIESIAYFDKQGQHVKSWGKDLIDSDATVKRVLQTELPEHQVFCPDNCYQQAIIPVMGASNIAGVLSIIHSFSDVIIKYREATNSDIGVLIADRKLSNNQNNLSVNPRKYRLSAMTKPQINISVYNYIVQHYEVEDFFTASKRIEYRNSVYEVRVQPIQKDNDENSPPYFLFIHDITKDIRHLNTDVKNIWLYSLIGLLASLLIILITLHLSLRRISRLSKALPLLSEHHFDKFKQEMAVKEQTSLGFDELDNLSLTAIDLAGQLEHLEKKMRGHTFSLMEKSQELAKERDFVNQLIELAPIIIIIQKLNGIILTINHAGVDALETDSRSVKGKVFDVFLPESDLEHLKKLNRLRSGEFGDQIQIDGSLLAETGKVQDVSWLHKLLPFKQQGDEAVILTLGLDISERKITEARNVRMAYYDYLTGLGNRRKFQEEFSQKLASAVRYGYQLALFYLDLDRFKEINDTCGHEAGDQYLKVVANTLKEAVRSTDLLCRLGGDEFTLLMPHADLKGVEHFAQKINDVFKAQTTNYSGKIYTISASIGIALFPQHGANVNELMANADLAMYRAKELGRGRYHIYDPNYDYRSKITQTMYWRGILEDAIANDRFVLFYQPILTIKSNDISHFECLVRLQQEDGKILMPSEFVFRAAELGLIAQVDRIVLTKVVAQHLEFNRQGMLHKLTVNISKNTFEDPTIFEDFAEIFSNPEIDKKRIIFEITDSTAAANHQSTSNLINKIKDLGCILALNDFGIEYPSLSYLKNAPVDYVKIDGSLIRHLDKNEDDKVFVKALIELAQAYGIKTVAEYVESEAILEILKEYGIDYAQGYHIGKPGALA